MGNRVGGIVEDKDSNLWFGTHSGIYKYDGKQFINYNKFTNGETFSYPVMNIFEDRKGRIWLGCAGGLFRLESDKIINITTAGPWE